MTPDQFFNQGGWLGILIFPLGPPLFMATGMLIVSAMEWAWDGVQKALDKRREA